MNRLKREAIWLAGTYDACVGFGIGVYITLPERSFPGGGWLPRRQVSRLHGDAERVFVYSTIEEAEGTLYDIKATVSSCGDSYGIRRLRSSTLNREERMEELVGGAIDREERWYE